MMRRALFLAALALGAGTAQPSGIHGALLGSAGGPVITAIGGSYQDNLAVSPTDAGITYTVTNGGDVTITRDNGADPDIGDWITPKTGFSGYDIRITVTSGSTPTGSAAATWLNLGTSRAWTISDTTNGASTTTSTFLVEIRDATTLVVLSSASATLTATVNV